MLNPQLLSQRSNKFYQPRFLLRGIWSRWIPIKHSWEYVLLSVNSPTYVSGHNNERFVTFDQLLVFTPLISEATSALTSYIPPVGCTAYSPCQIGQNYQDEPGVPLLRLTFTLKIVTSRYSLKCEPALISLLQVFN